MMEELSSIGKIEDGPMIEKQALEQALGAARGTS